MPVTDATDSAAPPRASPSSLDSTTPVKSTPSSNAWPSARHPADHRVDDEQNLVRLHGIADVASLLHQLLIHAETACGIDDHRVVKLLLGELHGVTGHLHRVAGGLAGGDDRFAAIGLHALLRRVHRHAGAFADHLQLRHCVRTLQIGRNKQRSVAGILPASTPSLPASRRLTGA